MRFRTVFLIFVLAVAVTPFTPALHAQIPSWRGVRNLPVSARHGQNLSSTQNSSSSAQNSSASANADSDVPDNLPLEERRVIAEYKATKYPPLLKRIQEAAGYDVPVDVKWAKLADFDDGKRFLTDDFATNVYFVPLAKAFQKITKEPIGAKTLKNKVKKVVVTAERDWMCGGDPWEQCIKFENGTLTMSFTPYTGEYHEGERAAAIVRFLNRNL